MSEEDAAVKRRIMEMLCEHFGFVPHAFTRRAVDLANEVIYSTMDSIEKVVKERLGDSGEVDKGILRLETLLESLIDLRFDQYEAYLHRNVFHLQPELLPYVRLDHHTALSEGLQEDLRGSDEALMREIEAERKALEQDIEDDLAIEAASARLGRRLEALAIAEEQLENLGFGISKDTSTTLIPRIQRIALEMPKLYTTMQELRDLPKLDTKNLHPPST